MDKSASEYFDNVIETARKILEESEHETDFTPKRSILHIRGKYGPYQVRITELFSDDIRKYRYYVLRQNWVEAGFDNAPDPRAIRMKYGKIGLEHKGKNVSHLHLENKTRTVLTEEITFSDFFEWLYKNISK